MQCVTCAEGKAGATSHIETEGDGVTARSCSSSQIEAVSCEGDITVGVILSDADAVHVIIEEFRRATSAVETGDTARVCSVVLETAAGSQVVSLRTGKLSQQNVPFLCYN